MTTQQGDPSAEIARAMSAARAAYEADRVEDALLGTYNAMDAAAELAQCGELSAEHYDELRHEANGFIGLVAEREPARTEAWLRALTAEATEAGKGLRERLLAEQARLEGPRDLFGIEQRSATIDELEREFDKLCRRYAMVSVLMPDWAGLVETTREARMRRSVDHAVRNEGWKLGSWGLLCVSLIVIFTSSPAIVRAAAITCGPLVFVVIQLRTRRRWSKTNLASKMSVPLGIVRALARELLPPDKQLAHSTRPDHSVTLGAAALGAVGLTAFFAMPWIQGEVTRTGLVLAMDEREGSWALFLRAVPGVLLALSLAPTMPRRILIAPAALSAAVLLTLIVSVLAEPRERSPNSVGYGLWVALLVMCALLVLALRADRMALDGRLNRGSRIHAAVTLGVIVGTTAALGYGGVIAAEVRDRLEPAEQKAIRLVRADWRVVERKIDAAEKPQWTAENVSPDVYLVKFLATSGQDTGRGYVWEAQLRDSVVTFVNTDEVLAAKYGFTRDGLPPIPAHGETPTHPGEPAGPPPGLDAPPDVAAPPPNARRTASGLAILTLRAGSGTHPTETDRVKVHYKGWTTDGTFFDSTLRRGSPASFRLDSGVIKGWTEGIQLMVVGEVARLWVPAELAYGSDPKPGQPVGMLVFDIELLGIDGLIVRADGIEGKVKLCDTSEELIAALGKPAKVAEVDAILVGLVDQYEYGNTIVQVRKSTDKVAVIEVADGWRTPGGLRYGSTELEMRKIYGRCQEEFWFRSWFECRTKEGRISFEAGFPKVSVQDERGLPREVYPLQAVRIERSSCPAKAQPALKGKAAAEKCTADEECASGWCDMAGVCGAAAR